MPKGRWICPLNTKPSADLLGVLLIQLADICHYILGSLLTLLSLDQSMCYYTTVLTLWDKPIFYLLSLVLSIFLPKSQRRYRFYSDFTDRQTQVRLSPSSQDQIVGTWTRHLGSFSLGQRAGLILSLFSSFPSPSATKDLVNFLALPCVTHSSFLDDLWVLGV